ncbi:MAG TPA: phospho-N-acetylmuramoyl-pentapeptide-transferase, partial [Acidimicrobiia bacterium]|nr:phospho-N-acetylmuramoyl-pentapeptide-transferase [Acidimicrobiia bacterium]
MIPLLVAAALGLLLSIFGTPYAIRILRRREIGQFIQEDIQGQHAHKQGTPTMGGVVFIGAAVIGWFLAHFQFWTPSTGLTFVIRPFGDGGWLAVLALVGMALVGFLDDWVKYTRKRSLGLSKATKFGGQLAI